MSSHARVFLVVIAAVSVFLFIPVSAPTNAQQPVDDRVAVVVETSDGSQFAGTLSASTEFVLVQGHTTVTIGIREVRRLMVSAFRESDTEALEADVRRLAKRLRAETQKERDAASSILLAMTEPIASLIAPLENDPDPEVAMRAQKIMAALRGRMALHDSRDLVQTPRGYQRGWLKLEQVELQTTLGMLRIARADICVIKNPEAADETPATTRSETWPPPLAQRPVKMPLEVVIEVRGGTRLVGLVNADSLALVDESGRALVSDNLISLKRVSPVLFAIKRRDVPEFKGTLAAKELRVMLTGRELNVLAEKIDTLLVGKPSDMRGSNLAQMVVDFVRAKGAGVEPPPYRFWVAINGQPANPWDSEGKKGMTWGIQNVKDQLVLVGRHKTTDAYKGDTSIETELPILAVRKRNLPVPDGVDPNNFYAGWSGGEVRLTRPVRGTELTSLEVANSIIVNELGDGWEMAEHHSPNGGGWAWWAYWGNVPE